MTKASRIIVRATSVLAAVVLMTALLCVDGVDYRPYFTTAYHRTTLARLQSQQTNTTIVTGELAAGFGRALLTPTLNVPEEDPAHGRFRALPMAGYGNRKGRPAVGVHDDLYVKAVAFRVEGRVGVMVGADALITPPEVTAAAMAQLEHDLHLSREQLYLSATHTHAGLGGWGEGMVAEAFAGGFNPGVRVWMADRIVSAVKAAVADLAPASLGCGSVFCPQYVRNRLVGRLGRIDSEFNYLVVRQASGRQAVLGSFAAHATVLPGSMMEFSADYPGAWQRKIELATGGMAVFLAGGVGSHGPVAGAGGFEGVERMGKALAEAVLDKLPQTALTNRIAFGIVGLDVALPPLNARLTDGWRLRPWLARRLLPVHDSTFLQGFRLDQSTWISTPCDFSGELALGIKDSFRNQAMPVVITSFNGDYIGYVVSSRYYHMPGYEPRLMSFFGPTVPDYLDELVRGIASALAQ